MYPSSRGEVERTFCGTCGTSFTYFRKTRPPYVDVNMATLGEKDLEKVEELGLVPMYHGRWGSGVGWAQNIWEKAEETGLDVKVQSLTKDGEKILESLKDMKERERLEKGVSKKSE